MTEEPDWDALEKELLASVAPQFYRISVGRELDRGVRLVLMHPEKLLTRNEVLVAWKKMAPIIRRAVPPRPDGWAVRILAERLFGPLMGGYEMGWLGREDQYVFLDADADHADWMALFGRLEATLLTHGVKWNGREGDFSLLEEDNGLPRLGVYIHRIEFLTSELINDIQVLLRHGHADWTVEVKLFLSPPFDHVPHEGVEIRGDKIVELWDRRKLGRALGDRLKIPRYARDDS